MTTTPNTTPPRFPRYCSECGEGMRTGYQHEEDTSFCYCSLDCAADGLEMTTKEFEEAYDNAVSGREAQRPSSETLVTFEDWTDSPHEDYESEEREIMTTTPHTATPMPTPHTIIFQGVNLTQPHRHRNVSAESHREAAEMFGVAAARRTFGRRGRIAALCAGGGSADGMTQEWSIFIGLPGVECGRETHGYNIHMMTYAKGRATSAR